MANATTQSSFPVKEVAAELHLPERTVRDLIASYELRAFDVSRRPGQGKPRWRITREAIDQFIAKRTNQPTAKPMARRSVRRSVPEHV